MIDMVLVEEFPHPMVKPVRTHIHHHEEIPGFVFHQIFGSAETDIGHFINLLQ